MQLVAYGAQDVYLTGNPQITFFKAVYKRHTNFAMECIEQVINGTPAASGRSSVTVSRNGDLVQEMFLEATSVSGTCNAANVYTGERMIADCELTIGGQRIDKHYQRWWRLFSELYHDHAAKDKWSKMVNQPVGAGSASTVYCPLIFFFNRNPGLALPLIALQYHEVRLDFTWTSDIATNAVDASSIKCWANYIYLDTKERRLFAQKSHEYLIEQVQFTGTETATNNGTKNIRLNYNHPVKELVWCFEGANGSLDANLWNMSNNIALEANVAFANAYSQPHESSGVVRLGVPLAAGALLDSSTYSEEQHGPLSTFKLQLNGQDRFSTQNSKYFNQVQPYYHHSGNPTPGVYAYSFALKPELHQPSGTCNFSRIDNATAVPTLKNQQVHAKTNMAMFATNYNVLRVMSGMGGLAYSN